MSAVDRCFVPLYPRSPDKGVVLKLNTKLAMKKTLFTNYSDIFEVVRQFRNIASPSPERVWPVAFHHGPDVQIKNKNIYGCKNI